MLMELLHCSCCTCKYVATSLSCDSASVQSMKVQSQDPQLSVLYYYALSDPFYYISRRLIKGNSQSIVDDSNLIKQSPMIIII